MRHLNILRICHRADIHSHFEVMQTTAEEAQPGLKANLGGKMRPIINVGALQGRTFLPDPDEDGTQERHRVKSVAPTDMTTADGREKPWEFQPWEACEPQDNQGVQDEFDDEMIELMAHLTDTRIRHHTDIHSHFEVMQTTAEEAQPGLKANLGGKMRPIINVRALQGRTFLPDPDEDGTQE